MTDVNPILSAIEQGDPRAAAQLLPLVYEEMRRLAAQLLAHEKPGQTLDATALVHEAYLRLCGAGSTSAEWANRRHFFRAAAEAMRRILIDNARRKKRSKHGGGRQRVPLDAVAVAAATPADDLLALHEALIKLAEEDAIKARLVELRFFAGLSVADAARCLGLSRATADRYWAYARAWLYEKVHAAEKMENP
jgi:RNA polymerase sigma factor (TIGR02999 family)